MDKIIEAILKLIPFSKLFELTGLNKELSAGLSVLVTVVLLYFIGSFIKKWQTHVKNMKAATDLEPYFNYKNVKQSTKLFIQTQGQSYTPTHEEEPDESTKFIVKKLLIPWFLKTAFNEKKASNKFYLILGDSGMGKTTFLINLYISYVSQFTKKHKIKLIPFGDDRIISHLTELGKKQDEAKNTFLLLDAFDEFKGLLHPDRPDGLTDDERFRKRLDEIIELTRDFREIVITSRTQYFPGQEEKPYELKIPRFDDEGFHTLAKLYISPFESNEIEKYLNKKYGILKFWNRKKKQIAKGIVEASPKLMVRPMLLAYIDYLVDSKQIFATTYQIYETLIEKWIEREANKRKNENTTREKFKDDLYVFSKQTALTIYRNQKYTGTLSIDKDTATTLCNTENLNLKDYEITGQSLLTRDANHNWKFAHKSILEFFLAKQCLEDNEFAKKFEFTGMDMANTFFIEKGGVQMIFVKGDNLKIENTEHDFEKLIPEVRMPDFYIGKFPITQKLWQEIMGYNPSNFKGENNPVEQVSWNDVQEFIKILNAKTGKKYRLPSETEWEYAASGGIKSKGYKYAGSNNIDEVAWYSINSYDLGEEHKNYGTNPVGRKKGNYLELYEMSGNVWEWCQDKWHNNFYGMINDATAWDSGDSTRRVNRGGSWRTDADLCYVANRRFDNTDYRSISLGVRLAHSLAGFIHSFS